MRARALASFLLSLSIMLIPAQYAFAGAEARVGVVKEEARDGALRALSGNDVHPLSYDEVGSIMADVWDLNGGLTESEYRITRAALLTVGRIPYQLGTNQPRRPSRKKEIGDDAIREAADGVATLDCSHWVDWIYSIAMNDDLGYGNTGHIVDTWGAGSLRLVGESCSLRKLKKRLRPGDVMVYAQDGEHNYGHTAIFLAFLEDGSMAYAHESSANGNVSLHIGKPFGNGGSSPVYYFRHRDWG